MPNKDLVRSERVSVGQRVVDLLAGGGRGASSRCAPDRLHKPRSTAQECRLERDLELNRSVHRLDQVSRSLAPEDGVSSSIEIVKQVLDLWTGVQRSVAVVFLVTVAPVQRP